jgi:hypothetical protein
VLHFGHAKEHRISFEPLPPNQAEVILRTVLTKFIGHCIRLRSSTRPEGDRSEKNG